MATTTTELNLPDIQATPDQRATAIAAVGIRGLELPLQLDAGDGRLQSTLGNWDLAVSLAEGVRGTHMSRFVELASRFSAEDSARFRVRVLNIFPKTCWIAWKRRTDGFESRGDFC